MFYVHQQSLITSKGPAILKWYVFWMVQEISGNTETHAEPRQTPKMKLFTKIVYGFKTLLLWLNSRARGGNLTNI